MKELTIEATVENIIPVTEFVDAQLEALGCPITAQMQIDVAIDELFANIANYAYTPDVGPATVRVEVEEDPLAVVITFIDKGIPYDPLAKEDPDITLSAEEREIGGLGIFMVKQTMDEISYEYKDGQNILTIKKNLTE
ncbi:MAG: ATP-binding protein [Oscillospiraceae bacterium]|nr:ATP-binding protein [Oscillospiraceae bacterium]MBP1577413.1 ATP-binding protein [Oscillospiraceae bacterium]